MLVTLKVFTLVSNLNERKYRTPVNLIEHSIFRIFFYKSHSKIQFPYLFHVQYQPTDTILGFFRGIAVEKKLLID